ncbi:hypothetical protein [Ulvibacterium sp.]|uniref:hypothetical protein n=1 Tax=Ulvibacterium sp. TaxID=2665914 RepID=UPI003BAD1173
MEIEKITLKKSPPLEFIFHKGSFEIINEVDPENDGIYKYNALKSVEFDQEKTNWLLTILSYLVELFTGVGQGNTYKNQKRLTIGHAEKKVKLDLLDCEQKTINELISKLENIIKTNSQQGM